MGWGGDSEVLCTWTHVRCYASDGGGGDDDIHALARM